VTFKKLHLLPQLLKAIEEKGYENPTPIQELAIPIVLDGSDLLAGSQTGSGKTASFTLPILQNLMNKQREKKVVRVLILTPTRELAMQVEESVKELGKHLPVRSMTIFGGVNIDHQAQKLQKGVDIVVATPGRLLDMANQQMIQLSDVEMLVLDEADRMLDMGFIHDIRRILKLLPQKRQSLLFSATFSPEIKMLAQDFLNRPKIVEATRANSTVDTVSQVIYSVDSKRKAELLISLIKKNNWSQVLVFMRMKHTANRLAQKLQAEGVSAAAIHGNKSQSARVKALDDFKKGFVRVLVATDIAARGLDIDQLPYVVNFDLPNVPEDYVHRIGRTGRAGKSGEAISLVCVDEHKLLIDIEKLLKRRIEQRMIEGFEPDPTILPEPIRNGRRTAPRHPSTKNNFAKPMADNAKFNRFGHRVNKRPANDFGPKVYSR
jgi:ATP-dependent RNA helicase RhlE